jgi:hypothetical protein
MRDETASRLSACPALIDSIKNPHRLLQIWGCTVIERATHDPHRVIGAATFDEAERGYLLSEIM